MVHTKYPKEDCEQRPVLIPEVVSTDSWLNLSLAKHPKWELQSFDCEQRPVLIPKVVRSSNVSTLMSASVSDQASETGTQYFPLCFSDDGTRKVN